MQFVGDCHGFDPVRSQQAMDHVLAGTNHKIVLTKIKENQLQWLQNGRHSTKLLYVLDLKTVRDNPCLVEYGMRLANTGCEELITTEDRNGSCNLVFNADNIGLLLL